MHDMEIRQCNFVLKITNIVKRRPQKSEDIIVIVIPYIYNNKNYFGPGIRN